MCYKVGSLFVHSSFSCLVPQVPAELHPTAEPDPFLPGMPPDLHPSRTGSVRPAEQLLHHKPHGGSPAQPGEWPPGAKRAARRGTPLWYPAFLPQPPGQGRCSALCRSNIEKLFSLPPLVTESVPCPPADHGVLLRTLRDRHVCRMHGGRTQRALHCSPERRSRATQSVAPQPAGQHQGQVKAEGAQVISLVGRV